MTRDLEYLQQMYPAEAKKYQKIIADILDRLDYEGSMIYDEYPDRWQIYRLTQVVVDKLKKLEAEGAFAKETGAGSINPAGERQIAEGERQAAEGENPGAEKAAAQERPAQEKDWERIAEFVQVLLCYEIYRKRHSNRNGILKF